MILKGDAYRNERFVTFRNDDEGDRDMITTDKELVLRGAEKRSTYGG